MKSWRRGEIIWVLIMINALQSIWNILVGGTVIKLYFLLLIFFCRINNKMFEKESYEGSACWQVRRVTAHPASAGGGHGLCPTHEQSWCSSQGRQQPLWSPVWEQLWLSSEPFPGFMSHLPDTRRGFWRAFWFFSLSAVPDSLLGPIEFSFSDSLLSTCNSC